MNSQEHNSQRCKGMRDLLPEDMRKFRLIEDVFRNACRSWGYEEVRTPSLEYLHLFTATGTLPPGRISRAYSFLDWDGWSGERVVLRPDTTIPVARLFMENLVKEKGAKLFYVANVFAFEETGIENREQWQFGAERVGSIDPTTDTEVILLAMDIINSLGVEDSKISLSHAGVVRRALQQLGLGEERETAMMDQLLTGNWECLKDRDLAENPGVCFLFELMEYKGSSVAMLKNLEGFSRPLSADLAGALENFIRVVELLDLLGCPYEIDFRSIYGFEYYTGICFQISVSGKKVGGGGRYDDLMPLMGGGTMPASGFALYANELMSFLPEQKSRKAERGVEITGENHSPAVVKASFNLAERLRRAGYAVDLNFIAKPITICRWVVTVGEGENPTLTVLDMVRNQKSLVSSLDEVLELISRSA